MIHPPEAVEAVARALWRNDKYVAWDDVAQSYQAPFRDYATALLDQIAPLYREQAAQKVDAECARILSKQDGKKPAVDTILRLMACFMPELAAAIRKGE